MKVCIKNIVYLLFLASMTSCAVIRPGQVGMKQTIGKLKPGYIKVGPTLYNPFVS